MKGRSRWLRNQCSRWTNSGGGAEAGGISPMHLVESPDHVLPQGMVHARLAAHGGVNHGHHSCWYLRRGEGVEEVPGASEDGKRFLGQGKVMKEKRRRSRGGKRGRKEGYGCMRGAL